MSDTEYILYICFLWYQELKRLGLSQGQANSDIPWRISKDNERFSVCDTYPAILGLPTQVSAEDLIEVVKFRSKGRVPALCWLHPQTSASITRYEAGGT